MDHFKAVYVYACNKELGASDLNETLYKMLMQLKWRKSISIYMLSDLKATNNKTIKQNKDIKYNLTHYRHLETNATRQVIYGDL